MGAVLSVVLAVGLPLGIGIGIGLSLKDDVQNWYKTLKKPTWSPPNWLFGPVWTLLYTAMGTASWLVWKNGGGAVPLTLYALQAVLNFAWSPLFFREHEITFALADISALLGVLGATIISFAKVSPTAAYLLVPYLGWVSFATALTAELWRLNPSEREGLLRGKVAKLFKKGEEKASKDVQAAKKALLKAEEGAGKVAKGSADEAQKLAENVVDGAKKALSGTQEAAGKAGAAASETAAAVKQEAQAAADKVAASLPKQDAAPPAAPKPAGV